MAILSANEMLYMLGLFFFWCILPSVCSLPNHHVGRKALADVDESRKWSCFREVPSTLPLHEAEKSTKSVVNPTHSVHDSDDSCSATIDIPGVQTGDLNISVTIDSNNRHLVQIFGKRRTHDSVVIYHKLLEVDDDLDIRDLVMSYSNGVVELTIAKRDATSQPIPLPTKSTRSPGSQLRGTSYHSDPTDYVTPNFESIRAEEDEEEALSRDIWITNLRDIHLLQEQERNANLDTPLVHSEIKSLEEIIENELMGDHISDMNMEADDAEFQYWFNHM